MAVYTPATLIASKVMGNGAANIATFRKQASGAIDVHRTLVVASPSAARVYTIQVGTTAADTAAEHVIETKPLVEDVPDITNWWVAVPDGSYFEGFANSTDITASTYGYTYA